MFCIMGCKEISYIVTVYFNEYFILYPTVIGLCGSGPVTNRPVTISELDIDVQLVHQFSKIPGHKIKPRIDNMDKLQDDDACM